VVEAEGQKLDSRDSKKKIQKKFGFLLPVISFYAKFFW
jgi:hypothetical protein